MSTAGPRPRLVWRLRQVMATRGMFQTTDLVPLLEARGVHLSRSQIHRVVTRQPDRLNLHLLAALCDILNCTATDLLTPQDAADPADTEDAEDAEDAEGHAGRWRR